MFCKSFTLRDSEDWDATPNTNNPVESLNIGSLSKRGAVMCLSYFVIYTLKTDSTQSKLLPEKKNVNTSYANRSWAADPTKRRKRKRTSLSASDSDLTPPDKRAMLLQREKRKTGRALINSSVEDEYQEEKDGKMNYIVWCKGTIVA